MEYIKGLQIAQEVLEQLRPHCYRCEIAGSIRRRKPQVKDIDIVAIPKPYEIGLLESGIATVVNRWKIVRGKLPSTYTQRILPDGTILDLWLAEKSNWGYLYAMKTGSYVYNIKKLVAGWNKQGYKSVDGVLWKDGEQFDAQEEEDLFRLAGVPYVSPEKRNWY